ncbi:MAG: bifunctional phosphoglucose/phosphomannose isomerase [Anaerolineales bacterium]|nr:bifunctional phosphoglucose/phosphomannose isomerase [Anaerolineales bacterium]
MILDNWEIFRQVDPEGMLEEIDHLPDQLETAWRIGQQHTLPAWEDLSQVVIVGMGGSAIGGDLLQAYAAPIATVPIVVWRNYELPAFAGESTLVIASSHSGNTEEVVSAFKRALEAGVRVMAVTTGGRLADLAAEADVPLWLFEHAGQPRAAVGFSFALLLAVVSRLGIVPDPSDEMQDAIATMRSQQESLRARVPVVQNPAKRMAGQLIDRCPVVIGADHLAPVARRWRTQISEIAKAVAQFEELPEADHNMVAGVSNPESLFASSMLVFLRGSQCYPRNVLRTEITRQIFMVEGFNTDEISAQGGTRLAEQWSCLHFGDYVAYFLAMSYGVDPTPVHAIKELKGLIAKG